MKIIAVTVAGLIASTFYFDTAWAVKKSSSTSLENVALMKVSRKNETSIKPHLRSPRNKSKLDNWSTIGNVNPYTGKKGTKRP